MGSRRLAARRRRGAMLLGAAALAILAIVLAMPLARKAVNDLALPLQHADIIRQQATQKRLDPALIAAVIYAETKFDPRPSPAGAQGLMQILPQTADFLARRSGARTFTTADLATPQVNISYGSYYLRYLLDEYSGNTTLAVAAYNGGESNVGRWLARAHAHGQPLTVAAIPFAETRAYVLKVLRAQQDYRRTYASELGYG
ncbi:MAG: lytic transglycosylase domain-containing protein [Solirubrobacteraceae bacterium]